MASQEPKTLVAVGDGEMGEPEGSRVAAGGGEEMALQAGMIEHGRAHSLGASAGGPEESLQASQPRGGDDGSGGVVDRIRPEVPRSIRDGNSAAVTFVPWEEPDVLEDCGEVITLVGDGVCGFADAVDENGLGVACWQKEVEIRLAQRAEESKKETAALAYDASTTVGATLLLNNRITEKRRVEAEAMEAARRGAKTQTQATPVPAVPKVIEPAVGPEGGQALGSIDEGISYLRQLGTRPLPG